MNQDKEPVLLDYHQQIVESMESLDIHQNVLTRYYTPMYCIRLAAKQIDPQCILFHSNRICVLTLAPHHPITHYKKTICRINFAIDGEDRLSNEVRGKGKRGGQKLMPETKLCILECADGTAYPVYSCVKGKLIEVNENLVKDPNLLLGFPKMEGYLAIVLCDLTAIDDNKKSMLSESDYLKTISIDENYNSN